MLLSALFLAAATAAAPVQTAHRRTPYVGAVAVDCSGGKVLFSDRADAECYPASCTKLMTARLALKAIRLGALKLDDRLVQSPVSYRERPSWLGIKPGASVSVRDGLSALMVQSANDVAVMFAERLGGTTERFVEMMNAEARRLGMSNTRFSSPNGYPPPRGSKRGYDRSTAADLAVLGRALVADYPEILGYTSIERLTVPGVVTKEGRLLQMSNHNNLLVGNPRRGIAKMAEVDGLKTGYHEAGGYSVVLTGKRNGKRAIVVVTGSPSSAVRDETAGRMLSDALFVIAW